MSVEKYKIAICDDDRQFADYMEKLLQEICGERAEIDKYDSGEKLAEDLGRQHHMIVMDIAMDGMDGFETAKLLRERNRDAVLVFCSGECDPRPEFFEVSAYRYVKKEYDEERIKKDLSAAYKKIKERFGQEFLLARDSEGRTLQIQVKDIVYISKAKHGSDLHTTDRRGGSNGVFFCKMHLSELYERLEEIGFKWPHDSYIVNLRHINRYYNGKIEMNTGEILNISRARYKRFMDEVVQYWGGKY